MQNLRELHINRRLSCVNLSACVCDDLIDSTRTVRLQTDGEVTRVRFCNRGESHLQAGAARSNGYFGYTPQDPVHVVEDAVGLRKRRSGRGEVIQHKRPLIHLW